MTTRAREAGGAAGSATETETATGIGIEGATGIGGGRAVPSAGGAAAAGMLGAGVPMGEAAAMGVTSSKLEELGIVDATIPEPLGGAHRDPIEMASRLKAHLLGQVERLSAMDTESMLEARYRRLMSYGN